jgi:dihydropyrimidine dehydrogenase (NAD+) subunit PreA
VAGGADGLSLINTIKSIIGVDLDRLVPSRGSAGSHERRLLRPRGEAHRAAHGRGPRARAGLPLPISGIGGVSNWRDAAEFIAARLDQRAGVHRRHAATAIASSRT